jgi:hypothetical protein
MKIELYDSDLQSQFRDKSTPTIKFEHFEQVAQKVVSLVGSATFYRNRHSGQENYQNICAPVRQIGGKFFTIGDSFRFAAQIPDEKVGISGSRCSNCDGAVAFCQEICKHCGLPFVGPFGFPDIDAWRQLDESEKRTWVERIFLRKNHGRMTCVNVMTMPLVETELREAEELVGHDVQLFAQSHSIHPSKLREHLTMTAAQC